MVGLDVGLLLAVASAMLTALAWYRSQTRAQYAREREYAHILKNLEQQSQAHIEIFKELDSVKSITYINADVWDNQILLEKDPGYLQNLMAQSAVDRDRFLGVKGRGGNWNVKASAGKVFRANGLKLWRMYR